MIGAGRGGRPRIRPPRRGLGNNDIDVEEIWRNLESSFIEIHTKNASDLSYEQLYRMAYRIVLNKRGDFLYEHVKDFESNWLAKNVRPKIKESLTTSLLAPLDGQNGITNATERRAAGEKFLKIFKSEWMDHKICNAMLADVLMYMDRVYCTDHRKPSIYSIAMDLFRDQILRSETGSPEQSLERIIDILNSVMLDQIRMERDGDVIDKSAIKACTYMLDAMYMDQNDAEEQKLYNLSFEPLFLQTSMQFYQKEADRLLQEFDAGSYCRHTLRRISEEKERCRSCLSESTAEKIEKVVEEELIQKKLHDLIEMESGVNFMIANDRVVDLGYVFELNERIDPKKTELAQALQRRVVDMGREVNRLVEQVAKQVVTANIATNNDEGADKKEKPKVPPTNQMTTAAIKWVDDVLQLKDKYDEIWEKAFKRDTVLQTALTRSFTDFINSATFNRGPEYISLFIDDNMRKGIKNKSDVEVEEVLEKAITLLRYIQDKDLFERYYKKHLSRRLLMNKSISTDAEKSMISRMKIELGNAYTAKLEAMFKDMTISDELAKNYKNHVAKQGDDVSRIDLGIQVLTSGTWPLEGMSAASESQAQRKVVYPSEIDRLKSGFEHFYSNKHSGRKLAWQPQMGSADLKARLWKPDGKGGKVLRTFEYNVSTYAMLILLLFNDVPQGEGLTFEEIQANTNIPEADLARNLQSLAVAAYPRILIKEPMSRDVKLTDKFSFNDKFQPRSQKVKVGVVLAQNKVETDRERLETEKKNDDNRQYLIEAAVVRIMKQRKTLEHTLLITETIGQLIHQFKPDIAMIKHRIESLIEREYLERIEDASPAAYKYLA